MKFCASALNFFHELYENSKILHNVSHSILLPIQTKPPVLYLHVTSKHEAGTLPEACFPSLKDFDPDDPKGEKKAAAEKQKAAAAKKKKKKDAAADLDSLLDAGLKVSKGKKKK